MVKIPKASTAISQLQKLLRHLDNSIHQPALSIFFLPFVNLQPAELVTEGIKHSQGNLFHRFNITYYFLIKSLKRSRYVICYPRKGHPNLKVSSLPPQTLGNNRKNCAIQQLHFLIRVYNLQSGCHVQHLAPGQSELLGPLPHLPRRVVLRDV